MSPELEKLIADAPNMEKFPRTRLIELGLAEGWPAKLQQENVQGFISISVSEAIGVVSYLGITPIEGHDELLRFSGLPYNQLTHAGWRPVLEAAVTWRKNREPVME